MKSAVLTIFKKELARFFGDKRLAFTTILLPGLMIYLVYSFMGTALLNKYSVDQDYVYSIEIEHPAAGVETALQGAGLQWTAAADEADARARITAQKLDLLIVLPDGFDDAVAGYTLSSGVPAPQIALYYNSASTKSAAAFRLVSSALEAYEGTLTNKFDINGGDGPFDLATAEDSTGSIFSSMLPMLLMIFLFSGCMAVAPESIAGEKERGTIATLLVTPARRSDIAIGKITALSLIALLAGASSTLGTVLALPKLMGGAEEGISGKVYRPQDYLLLGIVILSTVLVLVTMISLISAFARTTKEAQGYITPLMILVMLVGVTAMFGNGASTRLFAYCIPIYNSVQCMTAILSFKAVPAHILAAVAVNLLCTGLGVFLLTRMFNSERIIYSK